MPGSMFFILLVRPAAGSGEDSSTWALRLILAHILLRSFSCIRLQNLSPWPFYSLGSFPTSFRRFNRQCFSTRRIFIAGHRAKALCVLRQPPPGFSRWTSDLCVCCSMLLYTTWCNRSTRQYRSEVHVLRTYSAVQHMHAAGQVLLFTMVSFICFLNSRHCLVTSFCNDFY